ncbi:TonB family protein [Marinilabilia rubra]|uniref:TonB family protein n=1 Tax=Marinilabilia rubra TaxID=2162893 RepID=A0A2U2B5S1_9BACT|nr:TonB family protein [Marinilabilia rubra]PWD98405.1 TonB family protein [Marinilabilia rubra]
MEALMSYLIRSTIWLTVFGLIYFLVLRNERFFVLNRLFLITGLLSAIIFPLITIRYSVTIPFTSSPVTTGSVVVESVQPSQNQGMPWEFYIGSIIVLGTLFFLIKTMIQTLKVYNTISSSEVKYKNNLKVVKSGRFRHSFSFFSYIIVNPSSTEKEYREILAHEAAHIRQYHWIDLVLAELLRTIQWFNPMAWLYSHYIRQNHEYLADRSALKATSDPAVYKAILINQLLGGEAIRLGHSFSYSLNKKRFIMMKNTSIPVIHKMKLLIILPVASIIFYAFSEPNYVYETNSVSNQEQTAPSQTQELVNQGETNIPKEEAIPIETNYENSTREKTPEINKKSEQKGELIKLSRLNDNVSLQQPKEEIIKGKVVQKNGEALPGTSIVIANSTTGTISDLNGEFELRDVSEDSEIVFSFVGFKTVKKRPDFKEDMKVIMKRDTVEKDLKLTVRTTENHKEERKPLIFLDGKKIPYESMGDIAPESIKSIDVLKDKTATAKYGKEGENGVIIITSKKQSPQEPEETIVEITATGNTDQTSKRKTYKGKPVFFVVEDMPKFPGGDAALQNHLSTHLKYPNKAKEKGIQGKVYISFIIPPSGKPDQVKIVRSVDPALDAEAKKVIEEMPKWIPGKQRGKKVAVNYTMPINFELGNETSKEIKYH